MIKERQRVNVLDNIIKMLIVFLLLGALLLIGLTIKDKLQKQNRSSLIEYHNVQKSTEKSTKQPIKKESKERVYTQEEMEEIMQMMIDQMQELNSQMKVSSTKLSINPKQDQTAVENLTKSLENFEPDELQESSNVDIDNIDTTINATDADTNIDTQNRVIIEDKQYSDENLDKLSKKIGKIIDEISNKKTLKTTYTKKISTELETREDEMRVIVVKKGDTLSSIALRAYGKVSAYKKLLKANSDLIKNPNHIYVGQRLRVPTL